VPGWVKRNTAELRVGTDRQSGSHRDSILWRGGYPIPHASGTKNGQRSRDERGEVEEMANARVAIIMGSQSDWSVMQAAEVALEALGITSDVRIISAHRTPERLTAFIREAEESGVQAIIAGAGCAAHLAGVTAAHTVLPVLGVPLEGSALNGLDALLATVQMPGGIPVATFAIGKAGAKNAALFAGAILACSDDAVRERLAKFRDTQSAAVPHAPKRD
jgi:5-(carboxyamino)imidazole ribonucleotide mutase